MSSVDKIDLDAIIQGIISNNGKGFAHANDFAKAVAKEAVRQTIEITRKNARLKRKHNSVAGEGVFSPNSFYIEGIPVLEKLIQ